MREFELKPLSEKAIPAALEKAKHYRLLNEPRPAESICLDILEIDPDNEEALVVLILAVSDRFQRSGLDGVNQARSYIARLKDEYQRQYYEGLVCERRGKAVMRLQRPRYQYAAYGWLRQAMEHYESAEKIRPEGHDEPILRWNNCVRILESHPELGPEPEESGPHHMLE